MNLLDPNNVRWDMVGTITLAPPRFLKEWGTYESSFFSATSDPVSISAGDTVEGVIARLGDNLFEPSLFLNLFFDSSLVGSVEVSGSTSQSFSFSLDGYAGSSGALQILLSNTDSSFGGNYVAYFYGPGVEVTVNSAVSYNCECESDAENNETRGELRARLMSLLGYGAQAASPPPGMADLLNNFLDQAQRLLYRRLTQFGWIRFYRWPLVGGVYLYDLPDNVDACDRKLDPRKMKWVGIHKDGIWRELVQGIDPSLYSHDVTAQWPTRYEVRQCIEVWPKPQDDGGYLVIKGAFGLQRFTEDTDKTTVNSDLVFLQALANAKAHYRKPDARLIQDQAEVMLRGIVAGEHMTARYIPGRGRRTADPAFVYDWPQAIPPFGGP